MTIPEFVYEAQPESRHGLLSRPDREICPAPIVAVIVDSERVKRHIQFAHIPDFSAVYLSCIWNPTIVNQLIELARRNPKIYGGFGTGQTTTGGLPNLG